MSEGAESFLAGLRSDLHGFGNLTHTLIEQHGFVPGETSKASSEWKSARGVDIRYAYSAAALLIESATDYLEALARILIEPIPQRSILLLCRGVLENSARAWWLLEPEVAGRERARRGILERLSDVVEIDRVRNLVQDEDEPEPQVEDEKPPPSLDEIVATATELGHAVSRKRDHFFVDGSARPSATRLLKQIDGSSGEFVYRFLSASAHGLPYALLQGMDVDAPTAEWEGGVLIGPDNRFDMLALMLTTSLLTYCDAFDRQLLLYGWPRDEWQAWQRHALNRLRPLLPTEQPPPRT